MNKIYNWFKNNNGKKLILLQSRTLTPFISIEIKVDQLPHLIGLHYVYDESKGSEILEKIIVENKTTEDVIKDYNSVRDKKISVMELRNRINGLSRFIDCINDNTQLFLKSDKGITDKLDRKNLKFILYPKLGNNIYLQLFIAKKKYYYCESFLNQNKPTFSGAETEVKIKIE